MVMCVTASSDWACCHCRQSQCCVFQGRHPPPSCAGLSWHDRPDNATSHTVCSVRDFLQDRNVSVLPWPAKSPVLNPTEHIWDLLERRVRSRAIPPRNVQELAGALVEEWGKISQQELANLVQSMRRRCTAVPNAAGGHTRYWLLLLILTPALFRDTLINFC